MARLTQTAATHHFDADRNYEAVTTRTRWAAIVIVAFSCFFVHQYLPALIGLVVVSSLYNLLRFSALRRYGWFASKLNMLVTDNIFVFVLMSLTGGAKSPFFLLLIFMLISAAYWYGRTVVAAISAFQIVVWLGLTLVHTPVQPTDAATVVFIKILVLAIIGWHAERFTNVERFQRTEEERLNQQVAEERQRLLALINSLAEAVIAVDSGGKITLTNGIALELLDTNTPPYGKPLGELLSLKDGTGNRFDLLAASRQTAGTFHRDDLYIAAPDNSLMRLEISSAPIITASASQSVDGGFIILLRDVTQEKSLDTERDEFISVTSHELRTPLAIAEATLSTALLPTMEGTKAHELVNQAHDNIVFLGELVRDLATLSRAEKGVLGVNLADIDPTELLEQLQSDYQAQFKQKGLKLTYEKSAHKLAPVHTSSYHVHEILQNFVTNALKYTQKGGVTLSVAPAESGHGVVFAVQDTGMGMSASDQKKVFQKYFRAENEAMKGTSGTGLGLYITQQLAHRLGGKVWFESRLGKGSTFYLEIAPLSGESAEPPEKPTS